MNQPQRNSIQLANLVMYTEVLLKMGFISQHKNESGKNYYKLTSLGIQSGLKNPQN